MHGHQTANLPSSNMGQNGGCCCLHSKDGAGIVQTDAQRIDRH